MACALLVQCGVHGSKSDDDARAARERRIAGFAEENREAPEGAIVFLGSSTIEFWPLEEAFPGRPCLNRGIGAESAAEILERLDRSLPDRRPAGVVLYTGSADLRAKKLPVGRIEADAGELAAAIRKRLPEVPLLWIGVLPGLELSPAEVAELRALNEGLSGVAARIEASFLRTEGAPFALPDGSLDPKLARDRWHLDGEGYELLRREVLAKGGAVATMLQP